MGNFFSNRLLDFTEGLEFRETNILVPSLAIRLNA